MIRDEVASIGRPVGRLEMVVGMVNGLAVLGAHRHDFQRAVQLRFAGCRSDRRQTHLGELRFLDDLVGVLNEVSNLLGLGTWQADDRERENLPCPDVVE